MIHYITTNGIGNAWVANELRIVEREGVPFRLHALRAPESTFFTSDWARRLNDATVAIYPVPPVRLARSFCLAPLRFRGRFFATLANALFGRRESVAVRLKGVGHFLVACDWAARFRNDGISRIHSQWIHSSGTVAMHAARLLGVPFSFTGHATDLFRDRSALTDKIRFADAIICISTFHRDFYKEHGARDAQLRIVYCGIDPAHFTPREGARTDDGVFRIRSSGRLVEKKGFTHLVGACARLRDQGVPFECVIGGSGPLEAALREQIGALGLAEQVTVTGEALKQEDIPSFMAGGDVYCLPCVWSKDNDVDGLPQMLMEAMACGLPVVSTRLVGIPDLVIHEETGLLVEPGDEAALVGGLAGALARLRGDRALAGAIARSGREAIERTFDINTCLAPLVELFRGSLGNERAGVGGAGGAKDDKAKEAAA